MSASGTQNSLRPASRRGLGEQGTPAERPKGRRARWREPSEAPALEGGVRQRAAKQR
jgi:hypothetical protein